MITFDEVLLDVNDSSLASGGPEFATAIIDAGEGGSISFRNSNREDYISRYEIDFEEVEPLRRKTLRTFVILRDGQARGFRFLAPDDDELGSDMSGCDRKIATCCDTYANAANNRSFYALPGRRKLSFPER